MYCIGLNQVGSELNLHVFVLLLVMVSFVSKDTIVPSYGTCLTRHTKGPGGCVGLFRMSEYSDFILDNRNIVGPKIFVGSHRMSENSGVGLHKFHCITNCPPQERPLLL